jgi:ATP-dependent DNA helicase 2 subunit 2
LFNVVPKRVTAERKDGHVHAQGDDEEMLLLDRKLTQRTLTQTKLISETKPTDSDTEEDEEDLLLGAKPSSADAKNNGSGNVLPTPARSLSPSIPIDPGRAPGRIIGSTYPLADFQKNIAQGDLVSKAVEDLGAVVIEIVMKPFSSRRTGELMECMKVLRDVSLKVGID